MLIYPSTEHVRWYVLFIHRRIINKILENARCMFVQKVTTAAKTAVVLFLRLPPPKPSKNFSEKASY